MSFLDEWDQYRLYCVSATPLMGEEAERLDRLGIVEEFVEGVAVIYRLRIVAERELHTQLRLRLLEDEVEERRFLNEDAHFFAYKLFTRVSLTRAQVCLVEHETMMRGHLWSLFCASLAACLSSFESLKRLEITWEAMDSLALKACLVGRHGVREGQLARTTIPGLRNPFLPPPLPPLARLMIVREEEERRKIVQTRRRFMAAALFTLACSEKEHAYTSAHNIQKSLVRGSNGAHVASVWHMLEERATAIQSAFRGYRARSLCRYPQD